MPDKEVARLAVESSGYAWEWISGGLTGLGAIMFAFWTNITGRIKALEKTAVTSEVLKQHLEDGDKKFETLFRKHDEVLERVSLVGHAIARIEGKLENGGYRRSQSNDN